MKDKRGKLSEYNPTEDELVAACRLRYPSWGDMSSQRQENRMKEALRWLLVWGHVLPEAGRY